MARWGQFGMVPAQVRRRGKALTASSAALVLVASIAVLAFDAPGSHASPLTAAQSAQNDQSGPKYSKTAKNGNGPAPIAPLQVVSVSPAPRSTGVNGAAQITVTFSAPLSASSPMPVLSPGIAGTWHTSGDIATFTPAAGAGYQPGTKVKIKITGGVTDSFTTGKYSTLGLQALLAQLGYLPLSFTPTVPGTTAVSTAYDPQGTFSWQHGYPSTLHGLWKQGHANLIEDGAVRAFESDHGLTMDGAAGPAVWRDLLKAVNAGQDNKHGYTYALASKASPETLTIWHNGHRVLHTLANTGIPVVPTSDGTFPVYMRYYYQVMKGTNPDGSKYADPVYYVAYFNGGDAVHYFPRASYGFPQSLGCVELPWNAAAKAWPYLTYGSLVTVTG